MTEESLKAEILEMESVARSLRGATSGGIGDEEEEGEKEGVEEARQMEKEEAEAMEKAEEDSTSTEKEEADAMEKAENDCTSEK